MIKEIVVVHLLVRNQQFQILCSCATEAVVRQRKNLVVSRILHRKPVEVLQDRLDESSPLCQCQNPCCCVLHKLKMVSRLGSPHKLLLQ